MAIGQTSCQPFSVIDAGAGMLYGTANVTGPFVISSGSPYIVAPGATGAVNVSFSPVVPGSFTNEVVFSSNAGTLSNTVTGVGLAVGVSPASWDFGLILTNTTVQVSFVVVNPGNNTLTGTAVVGGAPFAVISGGSFTVPGFGSTSVVINFTPTSLGAFSDNATFTASAGNFTCALTGGGSIVPVALFSAGPTNGAAPLTVTFTDTSRGVITNRHWNFGDGATVNTTATNFQHTYTGAGGIYTVSLIVSGPSGAGTNTQNNLILATQPPQLYYFTTIAGVPGTIFGGHTDGTNSDATFRMPQGIVADGSNNLYVVDEANSTIRKMTQAGTNWVTTTIAGLVGNPGSADGVGSAARFNYPFGIALDSSNNLYVVDRENFTIRKLTLVGMNWVTTTIAGLAGSSGNADGTNSDARFYMPFGIAIDSSNNVYVTDAGNYTIRKITPMGTNWVTTTIAGLAGNYGSADGINNAARFKGPFGIALGSSNNLYVADGNNFTIRKITPVCTNWVTSTIAGLAGSEGSADGTNSDARFSYLGGIAVDSSDNVYLADFGNFPWSGESIILGNNIRKLVPVGTNWVAFTIGGLAGYTGSADGTNSDARFFNPDYIAVDSSGNVYVTDTGNDTIRKGVQLTGSLTVATPTITPNGGLYFGSITVSLGDNTLGATITYTTDGTMPNTNSTIYGAPFTLTSNATVQALGFKAGITNSAIASASFTVLPDPVIFIQPTNQTAIVGSRATFTVVAGGTSPLNYQWNFDGTNLDWATNASLTLNNVQLSQAGNYTVLVTNAFGSVLSSNAVLTVAALPPTILVQPTNQTVFVNGTATFSVTASGTLPLSYQWNFNGTNLNWATNALLTLTNVQFNQAGNYSVLVTNLYGSIPSSNVVLTVNLPPPCDPAPSGLVAWWQAEGNANDSIGTNNGTMINGATFAPGEVGQAFSLSGLNYVSVPDAPALNPTNAITVECWLSRQAVLGGFDVAIKKNGTTGGGMANGYSLEFNNNNILFWIYSNNGGWCSSGGTVPIQLGQWYHIAGVYDGVHLMVYTNGQLAASASAYGSIVPSFNTLCIGIDPSDLTRHFNGLVDEASIYNRALSSNEIAAIYSAGSAGKCPPTPPIILVQPTNQTVVVGGTATFNVSATGSGTLSYQWNFDGTNIVTATNTTLTLTNVQFNQAGNYAVLVTNLYGSVLSSNAVLMVTLDHFTWSTISSPRFVNTPFAVVIQARDMTNGLFTNFTGTAILGTTNWVAVTPPVSGSFIQGVWTGAVVISQTASNLVLQADDGLGHFGLANPINVISLPNLGMTCSGNMALFMWPVSYSGFVLETSGSLSPATWVVVPYSPIQIGDQYLVPIQMSGTNGFYRLWFPGP